MESASAGLAYTTKGNILFPGSDADAATMQAAAATRLNETTPGAPAVAGATKVPITVDSGDLVAVANDETTKYNISLNH
jgi:hypothetical protein